MYVILLLLLLPLSAAAQQTPWSLVYDAADPQVRFAASDGPSLRREANFSGRTGLFRWD